MPAIPFLCYHRIEIPPDDAAGDTNFTAPSRFAEQMAVLARWGCTGVTVRDVLRWQRGELALPARAVAITFDDAYASVVTHALPVLGAYRWPCTIYAVSSQLGGTNAWDPHAPRATLLDATTLRDALAAGHDVGSHSRYHRRLRGLDPLRAADELVGSRDELEAALGAPCDHLAFPYGSHDRDTLARVREAGYRGACTLKRWGNRRRTNPLRLGRMSVGGPLPTWAFVAKLAKLLLTPSIA
jgi:peptidoglycan/xylan/chitin deacetylase (PgdA/CDA1 family)